MTSHANHGRVAEVREAAHTQLRAFREERLRKRTARSGLSGDTTINESPATFGSLSGDMTVSPHPAMSRQVEEAQFAIIPETALETTKTLLDGDDNLSIAEIPPPSPAEDPSSNEHLEAILATHGLPDIDADDTVTTSDARLQTDDLQTDAWSGDAVQLPLISQSAEPVDTVYPPVSEPEPWTADPQEMRAFAAAPLPKVALATESDLLTLPGAGPGLVWMLKRSGVHSMAELAVANPAALRRALGLVGELLDIDWWISVARERAMQSSQSAP